MRDFGFFLDHGNFFKVVDTLEKFEQNLVNKESQAGRDFIMFKRQLYQMYEVRHRSVWEHDQFSLTVERRNLKWLAEANRDFIHEVQRINHLDQMADTGRLGGKVFKRKALNEDRVWGIATLGLGGYLWSKFTCLSLMMGPFLPSVAVAGSLVYGMSRFSDRNQISSIESLANGELKITYCTAPLKSETITCHVNDTFSVCALGNDDLGADDVDANLLAIKKHSSSAGQ